MHLTAKIKWYSKNSIGALVSYVFNHCLARGWTFALVLSLYGCIHTLLSARLRTIGDQNCNIAVYSFVCLFICLFLAGEVCIHGALCQKNQSYEQHVYLLTCGGATPRTTEHGAISWLVKCKQSCTRFEQFLLSLANVPEKYVSTEPTSRYLGGLDCAFLFSIRVRLRIHTYEPDFQGKQTRVRLKWAKKRWCKCTLWAFIQDYPVLVANCKWLFFTSGLVQTTFP